MTYLAAITFWLTEVYDRFREVTPEQMALMEALRQMQLLDQPVTLVLMPTQPSAHPEVPVTPVLAVTLQLLERLVEKVLVVELFLLLPKPLLDLGRLSV